MLIDVDDPRDPRLAPFRLAERSLTSRAAKRDDAGAGLFLAEPLTALRTQPAAAMSAMDGYAVRGDEPGPWRVVGESAAGAPYPGFPEAIEAVRI